MNRSSYRERDYAFGQAMLTLRTASGLTQAGLADLLGVSRHAVVGWEAGNSYPKADHLKRFLALCVQQQAFPAGREAEEIRALWKAGHSKVLLDERWLAALLSPQPPPVPREESSDTEKVFAPGPGRRVAWDDAPAVPNFFGREWEQALLTQWLVEEHCRLVSVLGLGGIGKSALAVGVMHQLAEHFQVVIWRSLRDAPSCEALLDDCLSVLAPQPLGQVPANLDQRLALLLEYMRGQRALIVLDNLEALLEEGEGTGRMLPCYEGYGRLLRRVAETEHQSCLLFTSREKPSELVPFEGSRAPVRALRLARLGAVACIQLLEERKIVGDAEDRARLIERYGGNPLALQIVAETITDLFGGEIGPFLAQDTVVFGSIANLLDEQVTRLSALERMVLRWLAVLREPVTLDELRNVLVAPMRPVKMLETIESLRRRSLIERGHEPGSFTLQSVVLEYATARLIAEASDEIQQGQLARLIEHGLHLAHAREYVRQIQKRLLIAPILQSLQEAYPQPAMMEEQLLARLVQLTTWADHTQGYAPANLLALLQALRGHLRGLDLSHLSIRGAYLQGVEMQDTSLSRAVFQDSVFSETFDAINAVATSRTGEYWVASCRRGEIRVWEAGGRILHRMWQAHTERAWSLAFSGDGRTLASGSWDGLVKLWEVDSGELLWLGRHGSNINSVAFAPDGIMLASGGGHETTIWDLGRGAQAQILPHPKLVIAVNWSPAPPGGTGGYLLATGDVEGTIRLWELNGTEPAICVHTLKGHTKLVSGLAFAPDGRTLASASYDSTVKLWDIPTAPTAGTTGGRLRQTLTGHTERVHRVAWSSDGRILASGGYEKTIWLWDVEQGKYRAALHGHTDAVTGLAFTPDSRSLVSSGDSTLRVWDVATGRCTRVLQGNPAALLDVDWSPDGTHLASAGSDKMVTISAVTGATPPRVLRGHRGLVFGVGWSPNGQWLASGSWDTTIRLWDPTVGDCVQVLQVSEDPISFFCGVAWSPNGHRLASATYLNRQGVLVWDVAARSHIWMRHEYPTPIRRMAWSPDGIKLAGGGDDGAVYVWGAAEGTLLRRLARHHGAVKSVAWSPDGTRLASGSAGLEGGELFLWDVGRGERVNTIAGHPGIVYAVAWGPSEELLVSGSSDGRLRWWDVQSGECVQLREAHQGTVQSLRRSPDGTRLASCGDDGAIMLWDLHSGEHLQTLRRDRPYERLNITGIRGLTEAQKEALRALGAFEVTRDGE